MKDSDREVFRQKKKSLRIIVFLMVVNTTMFTADYHLPFSNWASLYMTLSFLGISIWILSMIYNEKESGRVLLLSLSGAIGGTAGRAILEWGEVTVTQHMNIWNVGLYVIGIPVMITVLHQLMTRNSFKGTPAPSPG
ncbi:hypothetical protein [Jeotgalibacillus aurantiacus]|uniref:hypothetical protein n=1 Tax=Jeotgalibacillus aurantiacus TaxID=2763266 RepID=UPI001D0B1FBC|nr:hypothetical protein [Jeotgalibacillus aurantiacus]